MTTLHLRKSIGFLIPLAFVCLALCASPGSRGDEVCNPIIHSSWINSGTGDWFDSSNWCGGVPIDHAFTCISNGGTAQITQADPTAKACETFLGQYACGPGCPNPGNSGNLSVDGGTLDTFSELHIGYGGTGKLTIKNSGVVNTFGADIGAVAGSNGSASVDGTNSQWTITGTNGLALGGAINGQGGTGLLSVTNGGKVTAAPVHVWKSGTLTGNGTLSVGSTGTATVDGTISRSSGTLTITGNLSLTSSAATQVSVTPQDPPNQADISVSGTVSLTGRLLVTMTGTFTPGTTYTLLTAADLQAHIFLKRFNQLPDGSKLHSGNHLRLRWNPEPRLSLCCVQHWSVVGQSRASRTTYPVGFAGIVCLFHRRISDLSSNPRKLPCKHFTMSKS